MDWQNAVFGPGWVWSLLSMVLVVGSLVGLYRQLRMQSTQQAIEHLRMFDQEYTSERLTTYQLELNRALRDGADPTDLPAHAAASIANFWDQVGSLTRRGHLDRQLLLEGGSGASCQSDWVRLGPIIEKTRVNHRNPLIANHFEWLADVMTEMSRKAGVPPDDATSQATHRDQAIARLEDLLRVERSLRTVIIASPEASPSVPPGSAAAEGR